MPGQAVGAVGDVNAWQLGVEQQVPGRAELGDVGYGAPADEQVTVTGGLRVPLFCGQQALGCLVDFTRVATLVARSSRTVTTRL